MWLVSNRSGEIVWSLVLVGSVLLGNRNAMSNFLRPQLIRTVLPALCFVAVVGAVVACEVPVFRYALERWSPDQYRLLVIADGPLDDNHLMALKRLKGTPESPAAAAVKIHDVSKSKDAFVQKLWKTHGNGARPIMVALYPERSSVDPEQVAATSDISDANIERLISSPARQEIVRRMSEGHSAVWIFLESGHAEKDQASLKTLQEQLEKDAEWLKLPSPEEMEIKPELLGSTKIRLQIQFSVVSVRRDDPKEQFLIDCLLNSESDLRGFDEPMAFPIFGRGRVLYAVVGQGISADTIREASSFIVGPCSCQVKEQNPGFDLLLSCDWDDLVGDTFISEPIPEGDAEPKLLTIPAGRAKP